MLKNLNKILIYFPNINWGLGIGDWAQSPIPNPQSPIPNPQKNKNKNILIINIYKFLKIIYYYFYK